MLFGPLDVNYCIFFLILSLSGIFIVIVIFIAYLFDPILLKNNEFDKFINHELYFHSLVKQIETKENFEDFYCESKTMCGINMIYLFKLLKTVGNNDVLTLFIKNSAPNELGIRIDNKEKNTLTESYLKMLDISEEKLEIPDIQYDSVISMPSVDLQKYCRDLSIISNQVVITSSDSKFLLESNGDFASQKIIIGEAQNGLIFSKKNQNVSESFDLKYLNSFTKSTNLCSTVEIFLKKDYPLVIEYNVANLGKLQFCLAPKVKED
jgi:proliferating cell nuclear antigen